MLNEARKNTYHPVLDYLSTLTWEGSVLGMPFIEELLAMVDQGHVENTSQLAAERERLRGEVENLVRSIAAGVPPETIAPSIRRAEQEIARIEARLRAHGRGASD